MKNMKFAMGCMAMASAPWALAQSQLQVYGVVDMAVSAYRAEGAGTRTMLTAGGNQASRLGFRGREDLGGGMEAGFDLESGLNTDTGGGQATNTNNQPSGNVSGGLTFNRKSYLYLQSKLGQLRLGRDYTPGFWNLFAYDPFRNGVGIGGFSTYGGGPTVFRASNSVGYFSPGCTAFTCRGPYFQAMYAMGENGAANANRNDGNYRGWRAGYGGENWDVAISDGSTKNAAVGDYGQRNVGGSYVWNGHRLMLLWGENRTGNRLAALGGADRVRFSQVGGWIMAGGADYIPVSLTYLKRNDAINSNARKFSVGYVHTLSKRTVLYGTASFVSNGGMLNIPVSSGTEPGPTPAAGGRASGFDFGIRHTF